MSLFQRMNQSSTPANYVSTGLNKTVLLVGLGNVGNEYEMTRHNLGFIAIDYFVESLDEMSNWTAHSDHNALISTGKLADKRVIAIKPTTFMNDSGLAVRSVMDFYKIHPQDIIVIHDDLDIDFGQIRIRQGGSSAGHNGIKSISERLRDENFGRIRIGIGPKHPPYMDTADFVLQRLNDNEKEHLKSLTREVNALLLEHLYSKDLLNEETRNFLI